MLVCSMPSCAEIVTVSGRIDYQKVYVSNGDDLLEMRLLGSLRPTSMQPAPNIIALPKALSKACAEHLRIAFVLLWVDLGSCANRLRIVVEHLLDDLGVERERNLERRIRLLSESRPGHEGALDALRHVGNVGSHEGRQDFETIIKCFEILELALEDLVDDRRTRINENAKKLVEARGKVS